MTSYQFRGVRLIDPAAGLDRVGNILVHPDRIVIDPSSADAQGSVSIDGDGLWAVPGLIDIQVHFRQPGFEYKETLDTGSSAALAGGVTSVVVMPNTRPPIDTPARLQAELEEARRVGSVRLHVAAAVTKGLEGKELTDHGALKKAGAIAVTDDGLPVMDDALMRSSLEACKQHDLLFMQHAEDTRISQHSPMNLGATSRTLGVAGQSADAEGIMVERDIELVKETGARYHVLHTSTKRSLDAVRKAKTAGLPVTCEASPHHLLLNDGACSSKDPNTKMNPPLRDESDRRALVEALADGTVDAVATDHAPHGKDEKAAGFEKAPFGVVGLETALAAVLSFVHDGTLDANKAISLMTNGPANVIRHPRLGSFQRESVADLCLIDPKRRWTVSESTLFGKSKNSAFLGRSFEGKVVATFMDGRLRFVDGLPSIGKGVQFTNPEPTTGPTS